MLMKQCLNAIEYLQTQYSFYHPSRNYQTFTIPQKPKKVVNYYLLWLVQAWQHMSYISTLNE